MAPFPTTLALLCTAQPPAAALPLLQLLLLLLLLLIVVASSGRRAITVNARLSVAVLVAAEASVLCRSSQCMT